MQKDLMNLHNDKSWFNYQLVINQLISICIKIVYSVNRKSMVKLKRIDVELIKLDNRFYDLITELMMYPKQIKSTSNLVKYTEKLLGGKRKREWQLESDLTF